MANLFEIQLTNKSRVYMRGSDDEFYKVVKVDTKKFLEQIIIDDRCCEILTGNISPYHQSKYHHAEAAFANSINNPVPLATVNYAPENNLCSFTDGATRTHFLLLNGARYMPMLCGNRGAFDFKRRFGYVD